MSIFLTIMINFFILLTPFFILSAFLDSKKNRTIIESKNIAIKTSLYILISSLLILFFGKNIFQMMGLSMLAYQIGSGIIFILCSFSMLNIYNFKPLLKGNDPSLIPLTFPIAIGPGTLNKLFLVSTELRFDFNSVLKVLGVCCAISLIGCLLYFSKYITKILGKYGVNVLIKITGMLLMILGIQSILNGIKSFI